MTALSASNKAVIGSRLVVLCSAIAGALGVIFVANGLMVGPRQHTIFSVIVGALLLIPFLGCLIGGIRFQRRLLRGTLLSIPTLLFLLVLEMAFRVVNVETLAKEPTRKHPTLEFERVPGSPGLDEWGFRNPEVPRQADVVVLGDSQTYGFGVTMSQAYPQLLDQLTGCGAYNMGVGGYGPLQYLALAERAASMDPKVVVVALYLGNDILEAHSVARLDAWEEMRDPAVRYPQATESRSPKRNLATRAFYALERHSRLVGFVSKHLRTSLRTRRFLAEIYGKEPGAPRYEEGPVHTVFTPQYRRATVDLSREEVRDGLRITRACLERIQQQLSEKGIETVLLLLHTKEYYYYRFLQSEDPARSEVLRDLFVSEDAVTTEILSLADRLELEVVDTSDDMVKALLSHTPIYPSNPDGHPNQAGHAVIAQTLRNKTAGWVCSESVDTQPAP